MQLARGGGRGLDDAIPAGVNFAAMKALGTVGDEDKAACAHHTDQGGDC